MVEFCLSITAKIIKPWILGILPVTQTNNKPQSTQIPFNNYNKRSMNVKDRKRVYLTGYEYKIGRENVFKKTLCMEVVWGGVRWCKVVWGGLSFKVTKTWHQHEWSFTLWKASFRMVWHNNLKWLYKLMMNFPWARSPITSRTRFANSAGQEVSMTIWINQNCI